MVAFLTGLGAGRALIEWTVRKDLVASRAGVSRELESLSARLAKREC